MDSADQAEKQESFLLAERIREVRSRTTTKSRVPRGSCYFCDEPLPEPDIFCDRDCKEDYDRLQRANSFRRG